MLVFCGRVIRLTCFLKVSKIELSVLLSFRLLLRRGNTIGKLGAVLLLKNDNIIKL
jgi:hypothetical protein